MQDMRSARTNARINQLQTTQIEQPQCPYLTIFTSEAVDPKLVNWVLTSECTGGIFNEFANVNIISAASLIH